MAAGVIYVLINPAFTNLLKIGKTTRTAEQRAVEMSYGTGIPGKFVVAYDDFVEDCDLAERQIFELLKEYRYKGNREFFELKLRDALPVVMKTISQINASVEEQARQEQARQEQTPEEDARRRQARREWARQEQARREEISRQQITRKKAHGK